jgi:hypothetical protein
MKNKPAKQPQDTRRRRVVGLDAHPDSFAAALLEGEQADTARVLRSATRQPLATLEAWMQRYTGAGEIVVLEASANSFSIAERLRAIGRTAVILESHRASRIGEAYLANDRLDAAKIARIYLSGLARTPVWQPDANPGAS